MTGAEFEKQHGIDLRQGDRGREGAALVGGGGGEEEAELRSRTPRFARRRWSTRHGKPLHLEVEIVAR